MSQFGHPVPRRHPATVTDRWGRFATTLVDDGQNLSLTLRGNRFAGRSPDGLELVESGTDSDRPPSLHHGDLWSCVIEWRASLKVAVDGADPVDHPLSIRLTVGDPHTEAIVNHLGATATLHLPTGDVTTTTPREFLEDVLADLRAALPAGTDLVACISCAFSDYSPAGSGFLGSLACFRDAKDAYRGVGTKQDLFDVWDRLSGFVQETFHCGQFEPRPPDTGYRG